MQAIHFLGKNLNVFSDYAVEKHNNFIKTLYVFGVDVPKALGWMSVDNQAGTRIKNHLSLLRSTRYPTMLVESSKKLCTTALAYLKGGTISFPSSEIDGEMETRRPTLFDAGRCALEIIDPLAGTLGLVTTLVPGASLVPKASGYIGSKFIQILKGVNGIALAILMCVSAKKNLEELKFDLDYLIEFPEMSSLADVCRDIPKLGKEISYIVLGGRIALSVFASIPTTPGAMAAISASSVFFSYLEFVEKKSR